MIKSQKIKELELTLDRDQEAIKDFKIGKINLDKIKLIQKENLKVLEDYINEFGFPFKNSSSEKAYTAGFLIVQHSGDIDLINKTIKLFKGKNNNEILKSDLAYLIDRSRILAGKSQLYGTQFKKLEDGSVTFLNIEDEENLDNRRKEMEMTSFAEYKKMII